MLILRNPDIFFNYSQRRGKTNNNLGDKKKKAAPWGCYILIYFNALKLLPGV
jgi:hypothetical protein